MLIQKQKKENFLKNILSHYNCYKKQLETRLFLLKACEPTAAIPGLSCSVYRKFWES